MSTQPSVRVDNREAHIGMQVIAERVFFGGKEPAQPEREALRGEISQRWAEAVERGELTTDTNMEIALPSSACWVRAASGSRPRAAAWRAWRSRTKTARISASRSSCSARPRAPSRCWCGAPWPRPRPPPRVPAATPRAVGSCWPPPTRAARSPTRPCGRPLHEVCRSGLHLASGSEHDRKRGAFEPELDHLPRVSRAALRQALGPRDGRPRAAVLQLMCHVREEGLCLHDDVSGQEVVVGAEALEAVLGPFVSHLRLVVLGVRGRGSGGRPGAHAHRSSTWRWRCTAGAWPRWSLRGCRCRPARRRG